MRSPLLHLASFLILVSGTALDAAEAGPPDPLHNLALTQLGATAKGSGAPFNRDWPPNNALVPGEKGGGTMFGSPLIGGRVEITLVTAVDIAAIEVIGLDYHGTLQPKAIDIAVDGAVVKHADLPETPGKPIRIPVSAHGRAVAILVTDEYPVRTLPDGKKGPNWGGWSRLRVLSPTDLEAMMQPVDGYRVERQDTAIAPTSGAAVSGAVEVDGQPRQTQGHPCTLWDKEDIAHYQEMRKTSPELQGQIAGLVQAMDQRLAQPIDVPPAHQGADGAWEHFSDAKPYAKGTFGSVHNQLGLDIANLGTAYALTGEAKYGDFAKQILLAYADNYPNYGIGARPGFAHAPSRAFDQVLGDAIWLIPVARGYDLIHDLPSLTAAERKHIEEDFFGTAAKLIIANHSGLEASTNWSAISTVALLIIGYATDNQADIDTAMWGIKGSKEKPTGGLFDRHFSAKAITDDGLWVEGAMGYQFMALQALITDAEILWHHGIDMYRYRDCALKRLFLSPIEYCYPDLRTPAIHDSGYGSIIGGDSYLYEYAWRRYHDPIFLLVLNQTGRHLGATYQQWPVSVLYDRDMTAKAPPVEWRNVNFFDVGYGMLRITSPTGTNNLILEYGPAGSHGHPDKLCLDFYAFDGRLMPDPGSIWYEQPLYRQWYRTTLAHNTMVVDELDQNMAGANQVVFAPAAGMGMQRAWTADACPGVVIDRAVFMTPEYLADVFGAFTRMPRKLDLAWHIRGEFASDLALTPKPFPEPAENGYCALANVRRATTDKPWQATITNAGHPARFLAAGGTATEVIVGDGVLGLEHPPTIIERRQAGSTLYGNVVDVSGGKDGYVKALRQEGGLEAGYGLLEVTTARGADLCFSAFRPGIWKAGGLETDAQQACVLRDGAAVRALYLGSGTRLAVDGATLQRSAPGLAYLERMDNGSYVLGNPSSTEATVGIAAPALAGLRAYVLDAQGRRGAAPKVAPGPGGALQVAMPAASRIELAPAGVPSMYDARQAMLAKRQAEQEAALAKAHDECVARTAARAAEAAAKPAPAGTVVTVGAAAMSDQGGGAVRIVTNKRAAVGKAFSSWDSQGHWLEYAFDAPAAGYYNLTLCYCSQDDVAERVIAVNGEVQEPFAPLLLPGTGGWANASDDWRLGTAMNPVDGKPLLLKLAAGRNRIRLTNLNGRGANVNYLAITSPDVAPTRDLLAGKLPPEAPEPAPAPKP